MKELKREIHLAMRQASRFSSRGMGFWLASLGAILQSGHIYKALHGSLPYEGMPLTTFSLIGAVALGGGLLYFVSRAHGQGKDTDNAVEAVTLICNFEMFLGGAFYASTTLINPWLANEPINWVMVIISIAMAIFIPQLIKRYAKEIRVLDRVEGEAHELSHADKLMLTEDINSMIAERLKAYTLDYEFLKSELEFSRMQYNEYVESTDGVLSELNSELVSLSTELDLERQNVKEALYKANETQLSATLSDVIVDNLIKALEDVQKNIPSQIQNALLRIEADLLPELRKVSEANTEVARVTINQESNRLMDTFRELADTLIVKVRERAVSEVSAHVHKHSEQFLDEKKITAIAKEIILKEADSFDISHHKLGGVKNSINQLRKEVRETTKGIDTEKILYVGDDVTLRYKTDNGEAKAVKMKIGRP